MKKIFLILITLVPFLTKAQVTLIPDWKFEQRLIGLSIDSDGTINGQILTADALAATDLNLSFAIIYDLTGLDAFINLEKLNTYYNPIGGYQNLGGAIDVSMMPYLKELDVTACNLTSLDLSNNPLLEIVKIGNEVVEHDVPIYNDIRELDLSNNPNVKYVNTYNMNYFNYLNMRNNTADVVAIKVGIYHPGKLPNVCIEVDNHIAATNGTAPYDTWVVDGNHFFSDDCKKALNNELFIQNNFKVYPNPAADYVTIEYDENAGVQLRGVQILDSSGKWIRSVKDNFFQIDVSGLSEGIYLFVIQTDKGNKTEKVMVK